MYKSKHIIGKRNGKIHRFALFFTVLMLLCGVLLLFHFTPSHVSAGEDSSVNKLQNGSFEDGPTFSLALSMKERTISKPLQGSCTIFPSSSRKAV